MDLQKSMDLAGRSGSRNFFEGKALALAILMQDTVLDLHYDSVFDACPICSCNGNIRTKVCDVLINFFLNRRTKSEFFFFLKLFICWSREFITVKPRNFFAEKLWKIVKIFLRVSLPVTILFRNLACT